MSRGLGDVYKRQVCTRVGTLALCYAECGDAGQALSLVERALRQAVELEDTADLSRLHRIRADILAKSPSPDYGEIERELREAIAIAQNQGCGAHEARAQARLLELFPHLAAAQFGQSPVRGHAGMSDGA